MDKCSGGNGKKPEPSTAVVKKQPTEVGNGWGRRLGRPRKLTPELRETIVSAVRDGNYAKVACQSVNIDKSSFYNWMRIGEEQAQLDESERNPDLADYLEFFYSIREAEANAEIDIVSEVRKSVPKDPRTGLEILGRKYPERWGKKPDIAIQVNAPNLVVSDVMTWEGTDE